MSTPEIMKEDAETILKNIKGKVPAYTPEWNLENEKDAGAALAKIFARMAEIAIKRLNNAPRLHFISFLETLNNSLIPAHPARAPLTFKLSKGTPENVLIPALTQASASGPDGKTLIFETEKNIVATPSKLEYVISAIKNKDEIFDHGISIDGKASTDLFTGKDQQKHILYIGDKNLFNVKEARIIINMTGSGFENFRDNVTHRDNVTWEFGTEVIEKENGKEVKKTEWRIINTWHIENNNVILDKDSSDPISEVKLFQGFASRWIRCRVIESNITAVKNIEITSLNISAAPGITKRIPVRNVQGIGEKYEGRLARANIRYLDELLQLTPDKLAGIISCSRVEALNKLEAAQKSFFDKTGVSEQEDFAGITPDLVFSNDIPIDPNTEFYPFGSKPQIYSTLYIASEDAFSKKDYKVVLTITLLPGKPSNQTLNKPQLSWEYWDGKGWSPLKVFSEISENFAEETACDSKTAPEKISIVTIKSMPELKQTGINGKETYWIRVRLVGGDYGKEYEIIGETVNSGKYCPPKIKKLMIGYYSTGGSAAPEYVFTDNNIMLKSSRFGTVKITGGDSPDALEVLKPFEPLPGDNPAVYFGFDMPLKGGNISLFISIDEQLEYPDDFHPKVKWYARIKDTGWKELDNVEDETNGFIKSGMVQFVVSGEMAGEKMFGSEKELFWISAVVLDDFFETDKTKGSVSRIVDVSYTQNNEPLQSEYPDKSKKCKEIYDILDAGFTREVPKKQPPKVQGFYLNSTWAIQSMTVYDEIIGSGSGEKNQKFQLMNLPVIDETIWVNEVNALTEGERKNIRDFKDKKDEKGNVVEFWAKWDKVRDFFNSEPKARHYRIDKTRGEVVFGDGKHGMIPPIGRNNIKATYSIGGGSPGNLEVSKISKIQSAIFFVDNVINPVASDGGTETEEIDALIERAPVMLKHRDRAVALQDFEWLTKEASRKVSRVKVLPNINPDGEFQTGCVTVIIVPESRDTKPLPSPELRHIVLSYLKERCSDAITLKVIQPFYVKIRISASIISRTIDAIPVIEQRAKAIITEFLHPLKGGKDMLGWSFGAAPCISDIYSILESIEDVDYVDNVTILFHIEKESRVIEINDASGGARIPEYALLYSGEHDIIAQMKGSG
jgi:Baseplate J-like protein